MIKIIQLDMWPQFEALSEDIELLNLLPHARTCYRSDPRIIQEPVHLLDRLDTGKPKRLPSLLVNDRTMQTVIYQYTNFITSVHVKKNTLVKLSRTLFTRIK